MISLEDVIAFCDLTPDEVRAVAEHGMLRMVSPLCWAAAYFKARRELNRSKTC